ncbi:MULTISPECIES: hypothetical protein [Rhizobium]|uniref:hypothetical protein n=1 Tax=Rhizobium TaxID=379 RepID=UPI00103906BA|nr:MULTISPECIES: hypothetical protein [Rhizobium]MBX5159613.1 hypothetical protein [Rhizobium sp. NZLR8]TCA84435.1 hypothetical protein E0H74_15200 [Rhizobium leguminosarum bv. viciae]TCA94668.1 hypothetical protein E0H76_18270 [Rhizobium leguminosarum bv. viciae]
MIIFPDPPRFSEQHIGRRLAQIASSSLSGVSGQLAGVDVARLSFTAPHQIWSSNLNAILANRLLANALLISWRYLLCDGELGVGEFEVIPNSQDPSMPFVALHAGSASKLTIEAISFAESLPEITSETYEARFLIVPAVGFTALWLHAANTDIIIPVTGGGDDLSSERVFTEIEVTRALIPRAIAANSIVGVGPRP